MKDVWIVANPSSGKKQAKEYATIAQKMFEDNNLEVEVRLTEKKEDISQFSKEACKENIDILIVMGGDGTVSELINGMDKEEHKPKVGIIPTGTVNNIAKGIGISSNLNQAVYDLLNTQEKTVDVGKINDRLFLSSVSAGSIPETVWEVSDDLKEKYGPVAYFMEGMKSINNEETYSFEIKVDGEKRNADLSLLLVGVSNSIVGIQNFFNQATYNDGKLHMFGLKNTSFGEKVTAFSKMLSDEASFMEKDIAFTLDFKKAEISLKEKKINVALDGEKGPEFPILIEVLPDFVQFLVPK